MGKIKNRKKNIAFRFWVYIEVISGTILGSVLCGTGYIDILRNIVVSITGIMVFVYYYGLKDGRMVKAVPSQKAFLISFAVSNLLVAFTAVTDIGTVWMAGTAAIAVMEGMGHAVSCHLLLMLQYLILSADAVKNNRIVVFYAVLGILLALIVPEIKKRRLFLYAAVIFISLTLVLAMVLNGGNIKEIWAGRAFLARCIAGDIVLLSVSWVTYCIKKQDSRNKRASLPGHDQKTLAALAGTDHMLMQRIKHYSEALYIHSVRTGKLSCRAAESAGYNKNLAMAGGLYHEAGRIYENEDYKEACEKIASEYAFPLQLTYIIKQHGCTSGGPLSPEAVLVMVSDGIISTDEYLRRTGKREQVPDERLIKSVFNSKAMKEKLDNSGMGKEQIEKLMDFYINNAFKEEV